MQAMEKGSVVAQGESPRWYRRRGIVIGAVVVGIPLLLLAWWLLSPLFLNTTVVEELEAEVGQVQVVSGEFAGADSSHQGSGQVVVYEQPDGSQVLRFENLDVTNGPDLHVILSPVGTVSGRADVMADGYVDLGELKGNRGDQNYDVPSEVDLSSGEWTVVIYCQPFHVVFATAALQ